MKPRYVYRFSRFDIGFRIDILLWWIFYNGNDNDTSKSFYFQKENKKPCDKRQTPNKRPLKFEENAQNALLFWQFYGANIHIYVMLSWSSSECSENDAFPQLRWTEEKKVWILWRSLLCFWCCCCYYYYCMHPTVVGITRERACIE